MWSTSETHGSSGEPAPRLYHLIFWFDADMEEQAEKRCKFAYVAPEKMEEAGATSQVLSSPDAKRK